ncbi:MAG: ATP-binding cassette domain-containing protein [Acidimicrobiales bacterium]
MTDDTAGERVEQLEDPSGSRRLAGPVLVVEGELTDPGVVHRPSQLALDQRPDVPASVEAVRFTGVVKRYGAITALAGASFGCRLDETVALLGPNGAGKSTSVAVMLGLLSPDEGSARVLGGSPRAALVAGRVGTMLQSGQGAALLPEAWSASLLYQRIAEAFEALGPAVATHVEARMERWSRRRRRRPVRPFPRSPRLPFERPVTGLP